MKVFVLGHRGMLGHVVVRYLAEQGMQVATSDARYIGSPGDPLIAAVRASEADWVVNAIGKIDSKATSPSEMMLVNAQLPVHLKSFLRAGQKMIHASSDGVFSGREGNYPLSAERDAQDVYGFSKILAEVTAELGKAYIIRTSIIGPCTENVFGLMGWLLTQKAPVHGFTNHLWNGISTLEWAKIAAEIINAKLSLNEPLLQAGCAEPVSKYELLKIISSVWCHPVEILPVTSETAINRTLSLGLRRAPIQQQLHELRDWYSQSSRGQRIKDG